MFEKLCRVGLIIWPSFSARFCKRQPCQRSFAFISIKIGTFRKFFKMRENFPSMRVSVRTSQVACVSRRMRETWKVCNWSMELTIFL